MSNNIMKAKVKKIGLNQYRVGVDEEIIEVYKLKDGRYNVFLGDKISAAAVEKGEHMKTYSESELEFI